MSTSERPSSLQRLAQAVRRRRGLMLTVALILVALMVVAWPFVRTHLEAVAVLDLVANQPVPGMIRRVVDEPVSTRDLTIATANGPIRARLYTPVRHTDAPALVVLHGVHHLGMDEPRLIAFASAMAACGLRVLTPELPGIKDYQVSAESIRTIGEAAVWMAVQNPGGERRAVGVMGLSFSGGLSLLAAGDPAYRSSIKFVVAIGSQDEMGRVARYYRTGEDDRPSGAPELLKPHEYGALVMEYEHPEDFVAAGDIERIRAVLRAHLYEDVPRRRRPSRR